MAFTNGSRTMSQPALALSFGRVGQALVGALFLLSGALKVSRFAVIEGVLTTKSVPLPAAALALAIALEVVAGLALMVGWRARISAIALAVFVAIATVLFHRFWDIQGPTYQNELNHFLKNVGLLGALIMIAFGAPARAEAARRAGPARAAASR